MIVRRAGRAHRFTVIDNDVIEDNELSFRALGLLTYILSKPDDWSTDSVSLARSHAEGRDAVRAALTDLELAGYIVRRKVRQGRAWVTETVVYDRPCDREIGGITSNNSSGDGFSGVGDPGVGNPGAKTLSTDTKYGEQAKNGRTSRARSSGRAADRSVPDDDDSPALGADPARKTTAERKSASEGKGTTTFGLVLRLKRELASQGFASPVNERALTKAINSWDLSFDEVRRMVEVFSSSPRRYLKADEVPWTGFIRQREALRTDADKVSQAEDPTAKFRTG